MLNVRKSGPSFTVLRAEERADLVRLAAQADDQHAGEIRMARVAAERAPQKLHAVAMGVHAAAGAVRQGNHAVHAGKRLEPITAERIGDAAQPRWPSN
jgi:hypothetical protein